MLRKLNKNQGFTLVEIMIVVGIITLLASISIPNLLRVRQTANEAAAIRSLRALQAALDSYRVANGSYPTGQTEAFDVLCNAVPPYLNSDWMPLEGGPPYPSRQGYKIQIKAIGGEEYWLMAVPVSGSGRTFILAQKQGFSPEITDSQFVGLGAASPN